MMRDMKGNRLFRKATVKVVFPDNIFPPKTFISRAEPRKGITPEGISDILMQVADRLEELYPWWEFTSVELTPIGRTARFVFKFAAYRATPAPAQVDMKDFTIDNITDESKTLEPETSEDITEPAIEAAVGNTLQELASQVSGAEGV